MSPTPVKFRQRVVAVGLCAWGLTLLAGGLAGCATPAQKAEAYEAYLAPWQGATEESLRYRWGPPMREEAQGETKHLTYVHTRAPDGDGPTIGFSLGGFNIGGGGRSGLGVGLGVSAPLAVGGPSNCTTTFVVEQGKIVSWTFEGAACEGLR